MPDPFEFCLISSLHKFARKFVQQLKALSKVMKPWKRNEPKMLISDSDCLASSFASMEVSNQLKQVFKFFDANSDGKISPLELSKVLMSLGHSKAMATKEAQEMVREMDQDGDGFIDIEEFMSAMNSKEGSGFGKEDDDGDLKDAFLIFDRDKNGFISAKELQGVLISLGWENCSLTECEEMIKGVDRDGDGFVDFEEFRSMMRGI